MMTHSNCSIQDELKLLDPTLVPNGTTTVDFTDANQNSFWAESAAICDEQLTRKKY